MSRKRIDGNWIVRVDTQAPSPYLKQHWRKLVPDGRDVDKCVVLDIGCGNGRNSKFLEQEGVYETCGLDWFHSEHPRFHCCRLGHDDWDIAIVAGLVNIFLANYVLMFLDRRELAHAISEIHRMANPLGARIMVELYKAVDSHAKTDKAVSDLQQEIFDRLGWQKILWSKGRFIAGNL